MQQLSLRNDIKAVKNLVDKISETINEIKLLYGLLKERQESEKKSDQSRFENIEVRINNYSDRIKDLEKDVAIIKTRMNGR
jgi:chromosome segregation ATPase